MLKYLLLLFLFVSEKCYPQENTRFHQFSTGINILSGVFKNAEINTEFMLNHRLGITCDLGYQFNTSAGKNLNLRKNTIEGYYGKIGPRLYFAPHSERVNGYLAGGFIYSYFKQNASINEEDFYEPSKFVLSTDQKLLGTYLGIGTLIKISKGFSLDFGTSFNFFSPRDINFQQDYKNVTNAQPGFGNFIFKTSADFGLGLAVNCSVKYEFMHPSK